MNFLAHLHLAHLAGSSLLGNSVADFVRGHPGDEWDPSVISGIYMHRRVDIITDGQPEVRTARTWFRAHTRRVAPITLDIMWDHFISSHWETLEPTLPLAGFIARARCAIVPSLSIAPPHFIALNQRIWTERWLERYSDMAFIANVLDEMATRRPRLSALRDSWHDLTCHYDALEQQFWSFYPTMMAQARQRRL